MERTGSIGRSARLVLAGIYLATLLSIADFRLSARFRNPHVLTEPGAWLVHVLMFISFVILVGALAGPARRGRWQLGAVAALAAAIVIAAAIGQLSRGAVWGFPLADLVWWFDVVLLVEGLVASFLAAVIAMP